jgi:hypothetical protein
MVIQQAPSAYLTDMFGDMLRPSPNAFDLSIIRDPSSGSLETEVFSYSYALFLFVNQISK